MFNLKNFPKNKKEPVSKSTESQPVKEAVGILRHELLEHGEIYNGFKMSLKSALEKYNCCGLPFEPEEEIAEKILNFMIGDEKD